VKRKGFFYFFRFKYFKEKSNGTKEKKEQKEQKYQEDDSLTENYGRYWDIYYPVNGFWYRRDGTSRLLK
jgi:hypothetical protein